MMIIVQHKLYIQTPVILITLFHLFEGEKILKYRFAHLINIQESYLFFLSFFVMQCKTVSIISTSIALSSRMYKMLAKWCFEIIEFLQILKIIVEWELEMGPRRKRADDTDDICF